MSTVIPDLLAKTSATKTRLGWEITRGFLVEGLMESDVTATQIAAVNAVIAQIGDIGTAHPSYSWAVLTDFRTRVVTSEDVEVDAIYKTSESSLSKEQLNSDGEGAAMDITISASTSQQETNMDKDGVPIKLTYTFPDDYKGNDAYRGATMDQGGMVMKMVGQVSFSLTRIEDTNPLFAKSVAYTGKVNSDTWLGLGARTVLCTAITGRRQPDGKTYEVTYSFDYKAATWDQTAVYINPDTGRPPEDVGDSGQTGAVQVVKVQDEVDFTALHLTELEAEAT